MQSAHLVIRSVQIPAEGIRDIVIRDGRIQGIVEKYEGSTEREIQGKGLIALPGGIDVHVHFRTPGLTSKEDWITGSQVALSGGYTTVLDMPNTIPPAISHQDVAEKYALIHRDARLHFGCYIGATLDNFNEIIEAQEIACGVKVYYGTSTGSLTMNNREVLKRLFNANFSFPIVIHAEDDQCIAAHATEYAGYTGDDLHSKIRDRDAAIQAVSEIIDLVRETAAENVHITHITTAEEVELIRDAKKEGLRITCDVTPHHLIFTTLDYGVHHNHIKVNPPVRTEEDRAALWEGLYDHTIDMVASDHAPHTLTEKAQTAYAQAPSGIPSLQTELLVLLEHLSERFTIEDVVRVTASNPSRCFHLNDRGFLSPRLRADIVLIDPHMETHLTKESMYSKCGWSPWEGRTFPHSIAYTLVDGEVRYTDPALSV